MLVHAYILQVPVPVAEHSPWVSEHVLEMSESSEESLWTSVTLLQSNIVRR